MLLAGLSVSSAAFSQVWLESGEAGDLPGTANVTMGVGPLLDITGFMDASNADMYAIMIVDEASFSATTVGGAAFDTQLFLFDSAGMGVSFNDDSVDFQSTLTSTFVTSNGLYYLAVSQYDFDADSAGGAIWLDTPFGVERAPDGPGAGSPVSSWSGTGGGTGAYSIFLTGTEYATVPEPGTLFAIGAGLLGLAIARRRK
jgi:hypothetical protein